jgi:beta-phosphoglucomutase family hydrolase
VRRLARTVRAALGMDGNGYRAVILDLDGVLTRTATLHAQAWKRVFDDFLEWHAEHTGEPFAPFELPDDYLRHVDGKPRLDGVRDFLASRGITLPEENGDGTQAGDTIRAIGDRKNDIFLDLVRAQGVETFPDAVEQVRRWRERGLATALITSSRNGTTILEQAGLLDLFDVRIDGNAAAELGLAGKPAPDVFLEAARRLDVEPREAVVVEDAISGVAAGQAGGFGLVVGVVRNGGPPLSEHGADIEVHDLRELGDLGPPPDAGPAPTREE